MHRDIINDAENYECTNKLQFHSLFHCSRIGNFIRQVYILQNIPFEFASFLNLTLSKSGEKQTHLPKQRSEGFVFLNKP